MQRIRFPHFATAFILVLSCPAQSEVRTRTFHFEYKAIVKNIPAGTQRIDVWVPVPHSDAHQQIKNLRIYSPHSGEMANGLNDNAIFHVGIDQPKEPFTINISLDASRKEHVQPAQSDGSRIAREETPEELAQYLKPDRLVPLDNRIRKWARDVVEQAKVVAQFELSWA